MLEEELGAVDAETISILFKNQQLHTGKALSQWDYGLESSSERKQLLDDFFYIPLNKRLATQWVIQEKTKRRIKVRFVPKHGFEEVEEDRDVPINNFCMSSPRVMGGHNQKYIDIIKKNKLEEILSLYESSWTQPLPTIDTIQKRQLFLRDIVDNPSYSKTLENIAQAVNNMLVPHLHLSSLTKLLISNELGSSESGAIHWQEQDPFYQDYLRFCKDFTHWFKQAKTISENVLASTKYLDGFAVLIDESPLFKSYRFAEEIVNDPPQTFGMLKYRLMKTIAEKPIAARERLEEVADSLQAERMEREVGYSYYDYGRIEIPNYLKTRTTLDKKYLNHYISLEQWRRFEYFSKSPILSVQWPFAGSDGDIVSANMLANQLIVAASQAEYFRDNKGWTLPQILPKEDGIIDIREGTYPLTSNFGKEELTPNNTLLDAKKRVEILDGTNRGGKTIDMKKTAFAVVCALAGNYVPAKHGTRISHFDKVYFRLKGSGLNDRSALEQELNAYDSVLKNVKNGSSVLICIDEAWSSTNAKEGEALTYGLVKRISELPTARGMFAIHYPQLKHHSLNIEGVIHSHFEYQEINGNVLTAHKKLPGANPQPGYAFVMAKAEGLNQQILAHAYSLSKVNTNGK